MRASATAMTFTLVCLIGCVDGPDGTLEPVVFPREVRLGASAAVAIDSNFIPLADSWEFYDLSADRVEILIDDLDGTPVPASVRSVFTLAASPSSKQVQSRADAPEVWTSFALFDLPSDPALFDNLPAYDSEDSVLIVRIDGQDVYEASIRIIGAGGSPTDLETGLLPDGSLERDLGPVPILRLRPLDPAGIGFDKTWRIGALELQVDYPRNCFANPRAVTRSQAVHATAALRGADQPSDPSKAAVRVLVIAPDGFVLVTPPTAPQWAVGEGPFLDIVFDRAPAGGDPCESTPATSADFKIRKLFVSDLDGATLLDRRNPPNDSTDLFALHVIDPQAAP